MGGCNRVWLTYCNLDTFLCPKCEAAQPAYDPQPYRPLKPGEKIMQTTCYIIGDPLWKYCVMERDGDRLVLRKLGCPDAEKFEISIHNTAARPIHRKIQG